MRAIFASGLIFAVHAVSGFETENFDLSEIVQTLEQGEKRVKRAFGGGHGKIITVDCSRGLDQASSSDPKYLVYPDFPDKMRKPITCIWSISASPGTFIQVNVKELLLPCAGGNKLIIKDGIQSTKPICGKKPPPITSTSNKLGFHLMLKKPGSGSRVQIGFIQKDQPLGWTVKEFNSGKKSKKPKPGLLAKMDNSGRMLRKPGTAPRPKVMLKSAGQQPQRPQQPPQQPQQAAQGVPQGVAKAPPKSRQAPPPPKPKYNPDLGAGRNYRHTTKTGTADRWEIANKSSPTLIIGGVVFLLLLVLGGVYIARLMKKDAEEQAKINAEKKEQPRFKIPDPVEIIDSKPPMTPTESYDNHTFSNSEKPLTQKL